MKLAGFLADDLKRAVAIYLEEAFGSQPCPKAPKFPDTTGQFVEVLLPPRLEVFRHDPPNPPNHIVDEYVLQLGNSRYPFMKFVLGEHLIVGEYFLSVDTHDRMFKSDASNPAERAAWDETLKFNLALKERIEGRWNEAKLPTLQDLRNFLTSSQVRASQPRGQRILVIDDDKIAAETLAAFLGSRGFEVEVECGGEQGLARANATRHHLVILDVDMQDLDGLEVCARLKADPARRALPVLLSSKQPLGDRPPAGANAFLVKPFQADVLLYFIDSLLPRRALG